MNTVPVVRTSEAVGLVSATVVGKLVRTTFKQCFSVQLHSFSVTGF